MKDFSIEYAHIYTNDQIGEEHETSLKILTEIKAKLTSEDKTFSLSVLVDDYSFPDPTFDYGQFTRWLEEKGFKPDIVLRESQLIPLCDEVLNTLKNEKLKTKIVSYVKNKKYPCSLFIASWYLLRLGYLKSDLLNSEFLAKNLHNILPESFKPFEDQGLEIMASSFPGSDKQVEYTFIEGRLIA